MTLESYSKTKEYRRRKSAEYRQKKMAAGECITTGCHAKRPDGHVLCDVCRAKMREIARERVATRKAAGECIQCGSRELVTQVHCDYCRIKNRDRDDRRRVGPPRRVIIREKREKLAAAKEEQRTLRQIALEALEGPDWDDLSSREKNMIERRWGLKTGTPETLLSIGNDYGVTRERIRQLTKPFLFFAKQLGLTRMRLDIAPATHYDLTRTLQRFQPITVRGRPVSETLVEERR